MTPLSDRILIAPFFKPAGFTQADGGLFIPKDSDSENTCEGIVKEVGKGRLNPKGGLIPMEVKNGDKVLFNLYASAKVKMDGQMFCLVNEGDVLAIL